MPTQTIHAKPDNRLKFYLWACQLALCDKQPLTSLNSYWRKPEFPRYFTWKNSQNIYHGQASQDLIAFHRSHLRLSWVREDLCWWKSKITLKLEQKQKANKSSLQVKTSCRVFDGVITCLLDAIFTQSHGSAWVQLFESGFAPTRG